MSQLFADMPLLWPQVATWWASWRYQSVTSFNEKDAHVFILLLALVLLLLFSHSVVSNSLRTHGLQHARLICPSPSPGACWNSCLSSQWCHPTIISSAIPFSSCLQSFPALGSFSMSQLFTSGGQRIGASASASVLPTNNLNWFPLGWTGWISLQSKGLSRVFSNSTVQSIYSLVLSLLYGPGYTPSHGYWKKHNFD